ncbi:hypothetical protein OHS33_13795 [Streptomyces sp. NBC_00536]|uniref:hypothetical protein n=1 Tax=Streptomyces sp. NBC_00536 TaxID=2975769 RepID=UPI002E80D8FC|nr:hypothetical protein [Streptomyces sp. NBC_00536]WUC79315.1 hypothetical protein OHS33_13795 [Streptomyces sp. NBC_00536]
MAEDVDKSVIAAIPFLGPAAVVANQVMIAAQMPALFVEHEPMTKYKQRVDALLEQLKGSQADHGKIADGTLGKTDLGHGFPEADGLYTAYDKVRTELEKLSKALGVQIEALGIAVQASSVSYQNMDEEIKQRMRRLNTEAQGWYDPKLDTQKAAADQAAAAAKSHPGNGGEM